MAEVINGNQEIIESTAAEVSTITENATNDESPDISQILAELAEAKARADRAEKNEKKTKLAYDKVASQYAEKKKEERARMTAEEQAQSEMLEQNKQLLERVKELEEQANLSNAISAYKGKIEDDKIEILIDAINEKDHDAIANLVSTTYEKGKKDGYAEYLKNRPPVNAGSGSSTMSMDEIMAIKDTSERQKAIAQNIHLFNN